MWWIIASCNILAGNIIAGAFLYVVAALVAVCAKDDDK